ACTEALICFQTAMAVIAVVSVAEFLASALEPSVVSEPSAIDMGCVLCQNAPDTGTVAVASWIATLKFPLPVRAAGTRAMSDVRRWAMRCRRPLRPDEAVSVVGAVSVSGPILVSKSDCETRA